MTGDRGQDLIERLLRDADEAVVAGNWEVVAERSASVLALQPDQADALRLREASQRALGGAAAPPSPDAPASPPLPIEAAADAPTTGLGLPALIGSLLVWPLGAWLIWRRPGTSTRMRIGSGFAAGLWALIVLGSLIGDSAPPAEVTSATAAAAEPSVTETITETIAETPAPTPTADTAPAATPAAECPTLAQGLYFASAGEAIASIPNATTALASRFGAVGEQPTLLFSQDWRLDVATNLAILQIAADEIQALDPPAGAEQIDRHLKRMATALTSATTDFAAGIDDLDAERMLKGASTLNAAGSEMRTITEATRTFCP